jgi:sugar phosphate isomerase/epimerase
MFSEEKVGVCFDVGHANNGVGDKLYEDLRECSHRLIHIHLHDNHGFHKGDEHLEPGEGIIDFNKVYRILKEIKYNGIVLLEISSAKNDESPFQFYERNYDKFIENVRLAKKTSQASNP